MKLATLSLLSYFLFAASLHGEALVSKETIDAFKKQTDTFRLENHIPVIYRTVANSDIFDINITSSFSTRDIKTDKKVGTDLLFSLIPRSSKAYNKEAVFALTEKYSYNISCAGGNEYSTCSFSTINEYLKEGLNLFASIVKEPSLTQEDLDLYRERLISGTKSAMSDPESVSDDSVNALFYPVGHPFRNTLAEMLSSFPGISRNDLLDMHKQFLNANRLVITAVGSIPKDALASTLNKLFGQIEKSDFNRPVVPEVAAPAKGIPSSTFVDRDIPTAYITMQFSAPSAEDPSSDGFRLLTRILNETFFDEVRVKRSLSYGTYASYTPSKIGVGQISSTTSKPEETLGVIRDVIEKYRTQEITYGELEEQRNIYATSFFLTQEEHSSLAASLTSAFYWRKNALASYEFPQRLSAVTPRDLKELAADWLKNFRVSVVYSKKKYQDPWSNKFVNFFSKQQIAKRRKKANSAKP